MPASILRMETRDSQPISFLDDQISVRSKNIQLMFPGGHGGLIWNRPVAVVVRTLNGQENTIPILDITRIVMFTLFGICFAGLIAFLFLRRNQSKP